MVEKIWEDPEIFCIPVALPGNPLRNLNSYVIRANSRALIIDTGFNRQECREALWSGLEELQLDLSKATLFLTHLHADHIGLVWDFVARGIPVYMGGLEYAYHTSFFTRGTTIASEMEPVFLSEGFPSEQIALQSTANQARLYAPRMGYPVIPVEDGQELLLDDIVVRAIRTPGHTPGHMVLYLPEQQLLFSGDHILFDITPNISIWQGMTDPLSCYLESLRAIRELPLKKIFPAHRASGPDGIARIDQLMKHHEQRLNEMHRAVLTHQGITAYDIAGKITWSARGLGWEEFPPHQRWFAMGETLSHLHHLLAGHLVEREEEQGIFCYYTAGGSMEKKDPLLFPV